MIDLKDFRVKKGMTQAQLAAEAKTTRTVITNIENGVAKPSISTAKALGKILGFDWWKFFTTE
jgi:transcriptional regulator with XRE-family HTH domain